MNECDHTYVRWIGYMEGVYRLYCDKCGKQIGNSECYVPGSLFIFRNPNAPTNTDTPFAAEDEDYGGHA